MPSILIDDRGRESKSVCDYHRIYLPYLRGEEFQAKSNLYIFNNVPTYGRDSILKLRKGGYKVVMDVDDSLFPPSTHMLYNAFEKGLREEMIWLMRNSDVVLVSTEILAESFKAYNDNIYVVPNGLPFDEEGFTLTEDRHSKSPFVWAGSETHKEDIALLPDLGDKLTLCGYKAEMDDPLAKEEWKIIRESIAPNAQYEYHRLIQNYMNAYDGHEICLAPLVDNLFNAGKSNLKILEAGAKGLPIICSANVNYKDDRLDPYVIHVENESDWEKVIKNIYTTPDLAKELGIGLAEQVRKHFNIKQMNDIRREIFRSL